MAHEEHKIAQDGQDKRQDEARWRQDAKNEGCLERFRPRPALRDPQQGDDALWEIKLLVLLGPPPPPTNLRFGKYKLVI